MSKHTKGPWETGGRRTRVEVRPEGWNVPMCVADCHPLQYPPDSEQERVANARLIAAAPELLAIIKDILPDFHDDYADGRRCDECGAEKISPEQTQCDVPGCWYVRIREAVAKAEGRD